MAWLSSSVNFQTLAVGSDGWTGADIEKVRDRFDSRVEYERAGTGAYVMTLAGGSLHRVWRQEARHAEQRLAEAISDGALVVGKYRWLSVAHVDVQIEQEAAAVGGAELLQTISDRLGIAVGGMAVGHMQDGRRVGRRMGGTPVLDKLDGRVQ